MESRYYRLCLDLQQHPTIVSRQSSKLSLADASTLVLDYQFKQELPANQKDKLQFYDSYSADTISEK